MDEVSLEKEPARKKPRSPAVGVRRYGTKSRYTSDSLAEALAKIKDGSLSIKGAAKLYNIPRNTLKNKLKNKHCKNVGRPLVFTPEEELSFKNHAMALSDIGLPISLTDLRFIIRNYLNSQKRIVSIFRSNMPGWDWAKQFLERHPDLKAVFGQNISRKRAQVNNQSINSFFDNLENELKDVPATNIFNFDETGFHDDPKKTKLLFRRGSKHPEIIRNSTKSCFTVMFCGNAAGSTLPPYFVFKAKNKMSDWLLNGPKGSRMNVSKSGWVDLEVFEDWFLQHLLPTLRQLPGKKVVIGDNLSAHLSLKVLKACKDNNISFIFLVPNSTHLLQPLDVCYFAPLKSQWRGVLREWRDTPLGRKSIRMPNSIFTYLIKKTLQETTFKNNEAWNMINGFSATGIFPVGRQKVLDKLKPYTELEDNSENLTDVIGDNFKQYLEEMKAHLMVPSKRGQRFQLPVEPGRSVSYEEVQRYVKNREEAEQTKAKKRILKENQSKTKAKKSKRESKKSTASEVEEEFPFDSDQDENYHDQNLAEIDLSAVSSYQAGSSSVSDNLEEFSVDVVNVEKFSENDFVIIHYEGSFFPGQVTGFEQCEEQVRIKVNAMSIHGKYWRWPEHPDEIYYDEKDLVKKIPPSQVYPVTTRGDYKINDSFLNEKWGIN